MLTRCTPACSRARSTATAGLVRESLGSLGIERTDEDLDRLGHETLRLKYRLKRDMGWSLGDLRLPRRFFETPTPAGFLDRGALENAVGLYHAEVESLLAEKPAETPRLEAAGARSG